MNARRDQSEESGRSQRDPLPLTLTLGTRGPPPTVSPDIWGGWVDKWINKEPSLSEQDWMDRFNWKEERDLERNLHLDDWLDDWLIDRSNDRWWIYIWHVPVQISPQSFWRTHRLDLMHVARYESLITASSSMRPYPHHHHQHPHPIPTPSPECFESESDENTWRNWRMYAFGK